MGQKIKLLAGWTGALLIVFAGCSDVKNNAVGPPATPDAALTFTGDIRPLLLQNCAECHSGASSEGQYDLSTLSGVLGSGQDGVPNAIPGNAQSVLLTVLDGGAHAGFVSASAKAALRKWVVEDRMGLKNVGVHPEGWSDPSSANFHGKDLANKAYDMAGCRSCHGEDYSGGIAKSACTNCHTPSPEDCSTCHGSGISPAPPLDLAGNFGTQNRGVGAHQVHLNGGVLFDGMACADCHTVPATLHAAGHVDSGLPAEVAIGGLGAKDASPVWDGMRCSNTYCHGSATPNWTAVGTGEAACGTCHGNPPDLPHPQVENCSLCHSEVVNEMGAIADKTKHVNGTVEFQFGHPAGFASKSSANFHGLAIRNAGWSMVECQSCHGQDYAGSSISNVSCLTCHPSTPEDCSVCHGSATNPAPPPDLSDRTRTTNITVGAHQSHLQARFFSNPLACSECHTVPTNYNDPGHVDSDGKAEINFGTLAKTGGAEPAWDGLNCNNTYCHGDATPRWTAVSGGIACGSCHGLPPAAPHPQVANCGLCHPRVADGNLNIINKSLHINGQVEVGR